MQGLNNVQLIGNVGRDVELRYTTNGTAVANISLATNRKYKNGDEVVEETEWHSIVVWGKLAETANSYLEKGHPVYFQGRLQTRQWEDSNGEKRYRTEIVAERMILLRGGNGGSGGNGGPPHDDSDAPHSGSGSNEMPF